MAPLSLLSAVLLMPSQRILFAARAHGWLGLQPFWNWNLLKKYTTYSKVFKEKSSCEITAAHVIDVTCSTRSPGNTFGPCSNWVHLWQNMSRSGMPLAASIGTWCSQSLSLVALLQDCSEIRSLVLPLGIGILSLITCCPTAAALLFVYFVFLLNAQRGFQKNDIHKDYSLQQEDTST